MKIQIFAALLLLLTACNPKKQESTDTETAAHGAHEPEHAMGDERTKELMAIHDSIMPAMDVLMDLKQKISADIKTTDSLLSVKPTADLKKRKKDALNLNDQLEKADKEMMGWMHQYKADTLEKLNKDQATIYIAAQTQKIIQVRDLMKKSLADARSFTQKN